MAASAENREPLPPPATTTWWRELLALAFFALVAVAVTWPLTRFITLTIPQGMESEPTVPLLNVWTVWWNADRALEGFRQYWDAPIFFPTRGAFAFSESQPTTLVVAPIIWLTGNRLLAYNIYVLLTFTLNGWFAARLLRHVGFRPLTSLGVGLLVEIMPFAIWQLGAVQLTTVWGAVWTLDCAWRWARRPGPLVALELGLAYALTYAACNYYGLFQTLLLLPAGLTLLSRRFLQRGTWLWLLLAASVATAGVLPIVYQQMALSRTHGWTRPRDTIVSLSAHVSDYTDPPFRARWSPANFAPPDRRGGWTLGPGNAVWVIALLGTILGLIQRATRRWTCFVLTYGLVALLLSLGPEQKFAGWSCYDWLRGVVPGFGQIRSPFRFAMYVQLAGLLLTAACWDALIPRLPEWRWQRWLFWRKSSGTTADEETSPDSTITPVAESVPQEDSSARRRAETVTALRWVLAGVLALALGAELERTQQRLFAPSRTGRPPAWVDQLRTHSASRSVIAMIPFPVSSDVGDYEQTTLWMYWQTFHGRPMLNGYSGFFPDQFVTLKDEINTFPQGRGLALLAEMGAEFVLVYEPGDVPINWHMHPDALTTWHALAYDPDSQITLYAISRRQ